MLYFAYGLDMYPHSLEKRHIKYEGGRPALLNNHKIVFIGPIEDWRMKGPTGEINIVKSIGDTVEGVLYFGLDRESQKRLDEEYRERNYIRKEDVRVVTKKKIFYAFTYAAEKIEEYFKPSKEYLEVIIDGAVYWGLSINYIDYLKNIETCN
jgi:hypothetical protein